MAKSVLDFIIRTLKQGNGDRETISGLQEMKSTLATLGVAVGTVTAVWLAMEKIQSETVGKFVSDATAVDKFASALSTTSEEASRLIIVGEKLGITSDTLQNDLFRGVKAGMEPTVDGLIKMADQYKALATPQEKADFLIKTFGRSGADLARVLGEDSNKIRELADADKALILSQTDLNEARQYEIQLAEMDERKKAMQVEAGRQLTAEELNLMKAIEADNKAQETAVPLAAKRNVASMALGEKLRALTFAEMDLLSATDRTSAEWAAQMQVSKALTDELENMNVAAVGLGVSGVLSQAFADAKPNLDQYSRSLAYFQNLQKNGPQIIDYLKTKLDDLATTYGTGSDQYKKGADELKLTEEGYAGAGGMIGYFNGQIDDETTKLEKLIATQIYQQASAALDAAGQLELARKMGLLSEADYAVAKSVEAQTLAYQNAREDQSTYLRNIGFINDAVDYARTHNQAITQDYILNYIEHHSGSGAGSGGGEGVLPGVGGSWVNMNGHMVWVPGRASGGPVGAGQLVSWNENPTTRPEVFVGPPGGGYIMTKQDAQARLGGDNAALLTAINALPNRIASVVMDGVRDILQYNRSIG